MEEPSPPGSPACPGPVECARPRRPGGATAGVLAPLRRPPTAPADKLGLAALRATVLYGVYVIRSGPMLGGADQYGRAVFSPIAAQLPKAGPAQGSNVMLTVPTSRDCQVPREPGVGVTELAAGAGSATQWRLGRAECRGLDILVPDY